jgi:hypothetical protein
MKRMKFTTAISVRETPTRIRNFPAGWEGEVDEAAAIEVCHFKAAKFVGPDAELHEKWVAPHLKEFSREKAAEEKAAADAQRKLLEPPELPEQKLV